MQKVNLACIFLASGFSTRFGENKLQAPFNESFLAEHIFKSHASELFLQTIVVTRYPLVALWASQQGYTVCENLNPENDIAHTISLGLSAMKKGLDGCMFSTCDMPYFTPESCRKLVNTFADNKHNLIAAADNGQRKNPVIFPSSFFTALSALPKNTGGNHIIKQNANLLIKVNLPHIELCDIDTKEDFQKI